MALSVAKEFNLTTKEAKSVIHKIGQGVATWRKVANKMKINKREIERMSSAFEHKDLQQALRGGSFS